MSLGVANGQCEATIIRRISKVTQGTAGKANVCIYGTHQPCCARSQCIDIGNITNIDLINALGIEHRCCACDLSNLIGIGEVQGDIVPFTKAWNRITS